MKTTYIVLSFLSRPKLKNGPKHEKTIHQEIFITISLKMLQSKLELYEKLQIPLATKELRSTYNYMSITCPNLYISKS